MALVANDPKAAKRLGVPQKVGKEFMKADKGRKFKGNLNEKVNGWASRQSSRKYGEKGYAAGHG